MLKALLLIGIIYIIYLLAINVENLTSRARILRTTGVYNAANEVQLPPGIIVGTPIFSNTDTYWDGVSRRSCDECPNKTVCKECPNVKESYSNGRSYGFGTDGDAAAVGVNSRTGEQVLFMPESVNSGFMPEPDFPALDFAPQVMPEFVARPNYFNTEGDNRSREHYDQYAYGQQSVYGQQDASGQHTSGQRSASEHYDMHGIRPFDISWDPLLSENSEAVIADSHGVSNVPSADFSSGLPYYLDPDQVETVMVTEGDDPEFWEGRGKLGCCKGKMGRSSKYTSTVAYLGTKNDDFFDGERAMVLGTVKRLNDMPATSVKLMQQNRLDKKEEPRVFLGTQGYVYKEPGAA